MSISKGFLEFKIAAQPLSEPFRGINTGVLNAAVTCCLLSSKREGVGLKRSFEKGFADFRKMPLIC
jgi:hypothetical protein